MDLKTFYKELRERAGEISEAQVVLVSLKTSDGGIAGVLSEAPREVAARMLVLQQARLATAEEAEAYRKQVAGARERAEQEALRGKVQVRVMSESDLEVLRALK